MNDSYVKCDECGKTLEVEFAHCLRKGWPQHCGYTMRLLRAQADIDAVVKQIVRRGFA